MTSIWCLMACGFWPVVSGWWLVVVGWWLVEEGGWVMVGGCWLLVGGCWLVGGGCWLKVDLFLTWILQQSFHTCILSPGMSCVLLQKSTNFYLLPPILFVKQSFRVRKWLLVTRKKSDMLMMASTPAISILIDKVLDTSVTLKGVRHSEKLVTICN